MEHGRDCLVKDAEKPMLQTEVVQDTDITPHNTYFQHIQKVLHAVRVASYPHLYRPLTAAQIATPPTTQLPPCYTNRCAALTLLAFV